SNIIVGGYRGLALSSAKDCKVINNTFYHCGQATMRFLTTSVLYPTLSGNILENNLFVFGNSAYFNGGQQPASAASFSNNLYQSTEQTNFNGAYWDSPALDAIKDPNPLLYGSSVNILTDAPNGDFHLIAGCPAEAAGKIVAQPALDFYGLPFSTTARSIGAAEVPNQVGVDALAPSDPILIFPNPASDYLDIPVQGDASEVLIYNNIGIRVRQAKTGQRIELGALPAGMYFLIAGKRRAKFQKI
ncbi:MAG: T9SS type A sorting domain-containing protein, partial [Saprospiraceae bacterium]|nr:T9SS type A sorting domain-containing protein [Saprospiraceae bacterium]